MSRHKNCSSFWLSRLFKGAIIGSLFSLSNAAVAFAPGGGIHVYPASKSHIEITEEALQSVYTSTGLT
jgi:hypothetical protein